MSDNAIRVEHLGKRYHIGRQQAHYKTLRESLVSAMQFPSRWLKGRKKQDDNTFWALNDISFEIKKGESVGIIGRNGAGKSTLLKVLSRITKPTTGRVELYGRVGSLLEVGTGFHPELSGRENIYLNGAILGMRRAEIERKFDEIVDFAEVEKFLDTQVKFYSSGMYMRLAFAVAAHLEPDILLVDEVLAVGDAEFQKKSLGKMGDVARQGRTVLLVSHSMNAIEQLCNSCIHLDKGKLKEYSSDVRMVVTRYLFGESDENVDQEWRNESGFSASTIFKPLRLSLSTESGDPLKMPVPNNQGVFIEIEGEMISLDPSFTIGYAIFTEDGNLLYWSYQTDTPEKEWPKLEKGRFIIRSKIPERFLNEGVYRIEMIAGLHYRTWLLEPGKNAPAVYLTVQGSLSDSPLWMIKRPGLLAPVFRWEKK